MNPSLLPTELPSHTRESEIRDQRRGSIIKSTLQNIFNYTKIYFYFIELTQMAIFSKLLSKYSTLQGSLRTMLILIVLLTVFFFINLFFVFRSKHESAYNALNKEVQNDQLMLQDTRVHNWDQIKNQ